MPASSHLSDPSPRRRTQRQQSSHQGSSLRSRQGCWTCRGKKVKCDETRPECERCVRLNKHCDYAERPRKKYTRQKKATAVSRPSPYSDDAGLPQPQSPLETQSSLSCSAPSPSARVDNIRPDSRLVHQGPLHAEAEDSITHTDAHEQQPSPCEILLSPACSLILSPMDYAAIHYFRSVMSVEADAKVPDHSGPAIVWTLAQKNPIVLHMVCALGAQNMAYRTSLPSAEAQLCRSEAMEHYVVALRLLATATQDIIRISDFDNILATTWLMILYEQKFGDGCGVGLITHLHGAVSLLQGRLRNIRHSPAAQEGDSSVSSPPSGFSHLTALSSRVVIWITLTDGGAAFNGVGGKFNEWLGEALFDQSDNTMLSRLHGIVALHKHSNLVYPDTWGSAYPQSQVLEDLASAQVLYLQAEAGQMRYMLSRLSETDDSDTSGSQSHPQKIAQALQDIEKRYSEYLDVACRLEFPMEGLHRRFVINIRSVVPFYYAVVLCFERIIDKSAPINDKQRKCLRDIMDLACKAFNDEGEIAMSRIAWPLFIAALESDDMVHQSWILARYDALQTRGENYRRAREALQAAFSEQRLGERRVSGLELVRRSGIDKFVI